MWNGVVNGVISAWNRITAPFKAVATAIGNIWRSIKGMFKLPHFHLKGTLNPLKWGDQGLPSISVDWYYKGGIFKQPTILGGIGVGDMYNGKGSNAEAVVPLDELWEHIDKLASTNKGINQTNIFNSPKYLSPSETARQQKLALREVLL